MNAPPAIDTLFRQALSMHQRGLTTHAKAIYEQILARQPAHFDSCHLLGVAHMQIGSPERAADLISKALTINPVSADAHFNLGHALRALGRTDEALASLDRAIGLRPGFADYHLERGMMLQAVGNLPGALACFEEATRLDPAVPEAHRRRAEALAKLKRLHEALASCEEAIRLAPRHAQSHVQRAILLTELGRYHQALASFDRAIASGSGSAKLYSQRGYLLGKMHRMQEGFASFDRAIGIAHDHMPAYLGRAWLHNRCEHWDLARLDYEETLKHDPANEVARNGLAGLPQGYLSAKRASELLAISIDQNSGDDRASRLFANAGLLRHLHRYEESFECLREANQLRLAELTDRDEWRRSLAKQRLIADEWIPKALGDNIPGGCVRLLVILGPSRSGKTTLEKLLCGDKTAKRGFEGGIASHALDRLQEIAAFQGEAPRSSGEEVSRKLFATLFSSRAHEMMTGEHAVVTITNPFLLECAHLIFDLYKEAYFVYLEREAIDNAAELFVQDYDKQHPFAYSPHDALCYVKLYQKVSAVLCRKMGGRAIKVSYDDLLASTVGTLNSIYEMLGFEPPRIPAPDGDARAASSVYREHFLALFTPHDQ
jgi:tetratricopeptide (TPR) repeat protein